MPKVKLGPALWLAAGISFILLGYQNCDFLGEGMEPYSSEQNFNYPVEPLPVENEEPNVSTIFNVNAWGRTTGCAWRIDFPNEILTVTFYINGPAGVGERVGEAVANQVATGASCSGHRFQFEIPVTYRDGEVHQLYAYAGSESPEDLIGGGPRDFAAYDYSLAGRFFFDTSVRPLLQNNCTSCHGPSGRSPVLVYEYDTAFQYLLVPTPFEGGTADTNGFISMINGARNHAGGNFCGGGSAVCNAVRSWWVQEFQ